MDGGASGNRACGGREPSDRFNSYLPGQRLLAWRRAPCRAQPKAVRSELCQRPGIRDRRIAQGDRRARRFHRDCGTRTAQPDDADRRPGGAAGFPRPARRRLARTDCGPGAPGAGDRALPATREHSAGGIPAQRGPGAPAAVHLRHGGAGRAHHAQLPGAGRTRGVAAAMPRRTLGGRHVGPALERTGAGQPALQRDPLRRRQADPGRAGAGAGRHRAEGPGRGHRHSTLRPGAHLRALRTGRQRTYQRRLRRRPVAGAQAGRSAGREDRGQQRTRPRLDLHRAAASGHHPTPTRRTSVVSTAEPTLQRVSTGVPGLDKILDGGLFRGAVYIVRGSPGAGKTILANQVCFHHVGHDGRALFVTLLAESHARMLQHMAGMSFYNADAIPRSLYYVSAFRTLEDEGLKGLMDLLRREIRSHRASLLVLDGLLAVEETSASDREFRKFIHELQAHAALADCTVLLLTNGSRSEYHPEHTMVDGLITLDDVAYGKRRQRELEIKKFRGSASLRGRHPFRITDAGIVLFPRIEAFLPTSTAQAPVGRLSTGIPDLDAMMDGGPLCGTSTLLLGASGAGKTTLGTAFLSRSSDAEPGLHF